MRAQDGLPKTVAYLLNTRTMVFQDRRGFSRNAYDGPTRPSKKLFKLERIPPKEVVQFSDAAFRLTYTRRTSPETKFGERSSDAVQAYARVRAEHGKRRALPSPEFSLNARIPTLPNCGGRAVFNCCVAKRLSSPSPWEGRAKRGEGRASEPARNPPRPEAGRPSQREGEIKLHDLLLGRGP